MSLLSVPLKTILAWHADTQNETPPLDYAICDGRTLNSTQQDVNPGSNYTVPDLRNSFLIGADITKAAGQAGVAVGNANINLGAGAPGPKGLGGENQHTNTVSEMPAHQHTNDGASGASAPAGILGGTYDVTFTSNTRVTGASGGSQPHENRPKYYGVLYIMRVKN